jgi:uncharacterized membrane protein YcaP (DUF421 family)
MWDGVMDERALTETRVSRSDVLAKLREADVGRMEAVRAVVLEATGDISVICAADTDPRLLEEVDNLPASGDR